MENVNHYIDGKWKPATEGNTFNTFNPANLDEIVAAIPQATEEDINQAVNAAKRSLSPWRRLTPLARSRYLVKIGDILKASKEQLAALMTREMGKILPEARGEVDASIEMLEYMAGEGLRLLGEQAPSSAPGRIAYTQRVPIGVLGLISPWNFPVVTPFWKLAPALVAGNTVVLKPAREASAIAGFVARIIHEAGLPEGVFNCVFGSGHTVGSALIRHPLVNGISFTGSVEVGKEVAAVAARSLKRVSLELGGKNALIVMDDADIDKAVEAASTGAFGTTGQRCTATSRILVHQRIAERFIRAFLKRVETITVGDGTDPAVTMGPMANENQWAQVRDYIEIGKREGAKLAFGGGALPRNAYFIEPTVFTGVKPEMRIAREEIFGPVACIMTFETLEAALEIANQLSFGLTSGIFTQNLNTAFHAIDHLDTGAVMVNCPTIVAETHFPFGGRKHSGNGHFEGGTASLDTVTEWKTVYIQTG